MTTDGFTRLGFVKMHQFDAYMSGHISPEELRALVEKNVRDEPFCDYCVQHQIAFDPEKHINFA
jgi:hypothetical protein